MYTSENHINTQTSNLLQLLNRNFISDPVKDVMVVYASGKYFTIPYSIDQVNVAPCQIFHRFIMITHCS